MTQLAPLPPVPDISEMDAILRLQPGRAHEFCGAARRLLAIWIIAQAPKGTPVLWIRPRWSQDRLHPQGLGDWISPEGLIMLGAAREAEALGCMEEALRSGAVAVAVVELPAPAALTPLRRLHLAAESGLARRRTGKRDAGLLALVLTPGDGGTPGVESRWSLTPCPSPGSDPAPYRGYPIQPHWILRRLRARMAPQARWRVARAGDGRLQTYPEQME